MIGYVIILLILIILFKYRSKIIITNNNVLRISFYYCIIAINILLAHYTFTWIFSSILLLTLNFYLYNSKNVKHFLLVILSISFLIINDKGIYLYVGGGNELLGKTLLNLNFFISFILSYIITIIYLIKIKVYNFNEKIMLISLYPILIAIYYIFLTEYDIKINLLN